ASRIGEANHMNVAFIVPVYPSFPGKMGKFSDFAFVLENRLRYGRDRNTRTRICETRDSNTYNTFMNSSDTAQSARYHRVRGGAIPDWADAHRLGPFARLYRWRDYWDQYEYTGGSRLFEERWGYTTYGPFERMLRTTTNGFGNAGWWWHWNHHWGGGDGILDLTRFMFHLCSISQIKLGYVLGVDKTVMAQYADQWITDYEEARRYVEGDKHNRSGTSNNSGVMVTRWYRVAVKSTFDPTVMTVELGEYAGDDVYPAVTYPMHTLGGWDNWMDPGSWDSGAAELQFVPRRWFSWQLSGHGPYDNPKKQPLHRWIYEQRGWNPISDDRTTPAQFDMSGTINTDGDPPQNQNISLRMKRTTSRTVKTLLEDPAADNPATPELEPVVQPKIITVTLRAEEDGEGETGIVTLTRQANNEDWLIDANGPQAMRPDTSYTSLINEEGVTYSLTLTGAKVYSPDSSAPYRVRFIVSFRKVGDTIQIRVRPEKRLEPVDGATSPWGKWVSLDGSGNAWFKRRKGKTTHDAELGLPQIQIGVTEDGEPIYKQYRTFHYEWRIFGGIELRNEFPVSNLIAGGQDSLPAPILIDYENYGDYDPQDPNGDEGLRRKNFSFLGIARRNAQAPVWRQQFPESNPSGYITAIAQAELFNNKSWDLWTQDWQVRLVPVTDYPEWCERLSAGKADAYEVETVITPEQLEAAEEYLYSMNQALVDAFLAH
ncbi:MAG: hypothetical protein HN909_08010, partial [Phycisphaerales bacterium]|nr:hypothetical protein [Phycisphaerales bacterium]